MEWIHTIAEADRQLFLFLNGMYNDVSDYFMFMVSQKESWYLLYGTIIWFIFSSCKKKGWLVIFFIVILVLTSDLVSVTIKNEVQRFRPYQDPELAPLVHIIVRRGSLYGFVSSHAANTFAIFTFTALLFRNRLYTFTMLAWTILVSYSRIPLGVHFPLDIAGGMVAGFFSGWLVYKLLILADNKIFSRYPPGITAVSLPVHGAKITTAVFLATVILLLVVVGTLDHYGYL